MKLTPDVLDAALEIDPGIAHLTVGEQWIAVNRMEARLLVRLQVKKVYDSGTKSGIRRIHRISSTDVPA